MCIVCIYIEMISFHSAYKNYPPPHCLATTSMWHDTSVSVVRFTCEAVSLLINIFFPFKSLESFDSHKMYARVCVWKFELKQNSKHDFKKWYAINSQEENIEPTINFNYTGASVLNGDDGAFLCSRNFLKKLIPPHEFECHKTKIAIFSLTLGLAIHFETSFCFYFRFSNKCTTIKGEFVLAVCL